MDNTQRFKGVSRLMDKRSFGRLRSSNVLVIGLGGVGSWVVESLARSGVGSFTIVDPDSVCVSNINRQLIATTSAIGVSKVQVMKNRVLEINPDAQLDVSKIFLKKHEMKFLTKNLIFALMVSIG